MLTVTRTLITASCLALMAAVGCGGHVAGTEPSGAGSSTGATIVGTVNGGNMVSSAVSAMSGRTDGGRSAVRHDRHRGRNEPYDVG